jgi:hypothetical protein
MNKKQVCTFYFYSLNSGISFTNMIFSFFLCEFISLSHTLEIIATCEEILSDMRSCAFALEDELKLLDGLASNALIDQVCSLAIREIMQFRCESFIFGSHS